MPADLSPLARAVLRALQAGPGNAEDLARATHLPPGVVDAALAELRSARRAEEAEPRRWRALPYSRAGGSASG